MGRFSVSNVQTQFNGDIIFNTFIDGTEDQPAQNTLHTYAINDDQPLEDTTKRLEHILPYNTTGLPILENDYDSQFIYIRPQVSVTSDHNTGKMIVDQDSLKAAKEKIEQQLRKDNILERLKIVYY